MASIKEKFFDWVVNAVGSVFGLVTVRDHKDFLQTQLTEAQKEVSPLKEEIANLKANNSELQTRITELEKENSRQKRQISEQNEVYDFDEDTLKIISFFSKKDGTTDIWELENEVGLSKIQIDFSLDLLKQKKYVRETFIALTKPMRYDLTQKGRKFILDKQTTHIQDNA